MNDRKGYCKDFMPMEKIWGDWMQFVTSIFSKTHNNQLRDAGSELSGHDMMCDGDMSSLL